MQTIEVSLARADLRWGEALALLQAGFVMRAREGISARLFMREVLGFADAYIEGVVSTVFLDDKPVDDIDAARLAEGSRIALSAAMPGLVGAVMRRHSPYAAFRETISYRGDGTEAAGAAAGGGARGGDQESDAAPGAESGKARGPEVRVGVKLFNSVMAERGPEVLARGIFLKGEGATEALRSFGGEAAKPSSPTSAGAAELFLRISEA